MYSRCVAGPSAARELDELDDVGAALDDVLDAEDEPVPPLVGAAAPVWSADERVADGFVEPAPALSTVFSSLHPLRLNAVTSATAPATHLFMGGA